MIDLRSDTVTRPGTEMRQAMASAEVGDDVFGDDPTVQNLEALGAEMLGKEAAMFAASGTQTNLCALLTHCARGDGMSTKPRNQVNRKIMPGSYAPGSNNPVILRGEAQH